MQTTGEQNYWQGQDGAEAPETPDSRFVGGEMEQNEPPESQALPHKTVTWQASEYIHHDKDFMWFLGLIAITLALMALAIFLVKSWTFAILIGVMAAATIMYARRPPRLLNYSLGADGLQIDQKLYAYHDFRAFAVVKDGPLYSIVLIPVKRFMPAVTVYFPEENGEEIVDVFGTVLPMEQRDLDLVDRLVRKLRF